MTPDEAADLAARTLAAIDGRRYSNAGWRVNHAADRERVQSDLAGFLRHSGDPCTCCFEQQPCPDRADREDGLKRTAALYGVTL